LLAALFYLGTISSKDFLSQQITSYGKMIWHSFKIDLSKSFIINSFKILYSSILEDYDLSVCPGFNPNAYNATRPSSPTRYILSNVSKNEFARTIFSKISF
jgi:hypothetical protein